MTLHNKKKTAPAQFSILNSQLKTPCPQPIFNADSNKSVRNSQTSSIASSQPSSGAPPFLSSNEPSKRRHGTASTGPRSNASTPPITHLMFPLLIHQSPTVCHFVSIGSFFLRSRASKGPFFVRFSFTLRAELERSYGEASPSLPWPKSRL